MRAAFCLGDIATVVDREEDVSGTREVRESFTESSWITGLSEHEGHAGSEEDDVGRLVFGKVFMLEISAGAVDQLKNLRQTLGSSDEVEGTYSSQNEMIYNELA